MLNARVGFTGGELGLVNDGFGTGLNGVRFFDAVNFFYPSTAALVNAAQVYDGFDGTGTLLASFRLTANATSGCMDSDFRNWTQIAAAGQRCCRLSAMQA